MIVIRVKAQDNNANGYLVFLKWYLDSIDLSSGIHQWCLDQQTNDILQVVLMKIANVQEIVFIDKSIKWFHASKFFQMVYISTRGINHTRRWFDK